MATPPSSAATLSTSAERASSAKREPRRANSLAQAAPMPRLAAVTMATGSGMLKGSARLSPENCHVAARAGVVDLGEEDVEPRRSEQRDARVRRMRAIEKL